MFFPKVQKSCKYKGHSGNIKSHLKARMPLMSADVRCCLSHHKGSFVCSFKNSFKVEQARDNFFIAEIPVISGKIENITGICFRCQLIITTLYPKFQGIIPIHIYDQF